jgi:hypothetical protein
MHVAGTPLVIAVYMICCIVQRVPIHSFSCGYILIFLCSHERYFAAIFFFCVNEWIDNECAECVHPYLNISDWFTCSHLSKGENRTRNRKIARVNRPLWWLRTGLHVWEIKI